MYRTSSIELFLPEWGQDDEDGLRVYTPSLNQRSFLHSRQQVREPTLIPGQHAGEHLLPHLAFAEAGQARQHAEFRAGESGRLRDVPVNAGKHIFVHEAEGMPYTKLLRGQLFDRHAFCQAYQL